MLRFRLNDDPDINLSSWDLGMVIYLGLLQLRFSSALTVCRLDAFFINRNMLTGLDCFPVMIHKIS